MSFYNTQVAPECTEAIQLYNFMFLRPRNKLAIKCQRLVRIEVFDHNKSHANSYDTKFVSLGMISAATPTLITATQLLRISQVGPLDGDFAEGWRKLPNELRIKILAQNLVSSEPIQRESVWTCSMGLHNFTLGLSLRHHIALGPGFASLALQVFYEENGFRVPHNHLPPRIVKRGREFQMVVRKCIKRLVVAEDDCYTIDRAWLDRLAAGKVGFDGLRYLHLNFNPAEWTALSNSDGLKWWGRRVHFDVEGGLSVERYFDKDDSFSRRHNDRELAELAKVEKHIRGLITFGGVNGRAEDKVMKSR